MKTAESEYIAMVKCLQFAIWTVLLLRELSFRVRYPIPILADNVAAVLIAKSPTHTKYARRIALHTHYIRSVLPFRDFILAYAKSIWNFADLNTKAVAPEIFRRLLEQLRAQWDTQLLLAKGGREDSRRDLATNQRSRRRSRNETACGAVQ
jgi:hypothetical protein